MFSLSDCPTLSDYITRYQVDGVLWKAERLLKDIDNAIVRNERVSDIARTIALMPAVHQVVKDDYIQKISKTYNIARKTLEKMVADQTLIEGKKGDLRKTIIRKNAPTKLDGDQKTFPFFTEVLNKKREFKGIYLDIEKYIHLIASFGFTRYSGDEDKKGEFTFVRLLENVITEVSQEELIDFIENFIKKDYDFDGAGCEHVDSNMLINYFYQRLNKLFSEKLFARVRNENPIIINRDTLTECFLYFKNGFVRITKEDYQLISYEKLDGSVWQKQMLNRSFQVKKLEMVAGEQVGEGGDHQLDYEASFSNDRPLGDYADFIWRISGQKPQRFLAFCTLVGYLMHDYYDYKLKCVLLTDSTISEKSEGRTGKTLAMQMLGNARSYCEINGKQFNAEDERKFQLADRSTQILHINDVNHKGRMRFDFESLFNDITEGYYVRKMFESPFRHRSKMVVSTNKSLNIEGASARDRIVEFEMSNFFGEHRSPLQYYGRWMGKGWSEDDWVLFDNFLCFCSQIFLNHGLVTPDTINLEARKLLDHTAPEFLEFMTDIEDSVATRGLPWEGYKDDLSTSAFEDRKTTLADWRLDKKKMFDRFVGSYPDFKNSHFNQRSFTRFLLRYASLKLKIKEPTETRSNGNSYIQFKERT